jgi:hypothetical protein
MRQTLVLLVVVTIVCVPDPLGVSAGCSGGSSRRGVKEVLERVEEMVQRISETMSGCQIKGKPLKPILDNGENLVLHHIAYYWYIDSVSRRSTNEPDIFVGNIYRFFFHANILERGEYDVDNVIVFGRINGIRCRSKSLLSDYSAIPPCIHACIVQYCAVLYMHDDSQPVRFLYQSIGNCQKQMLKSYNEGEYLQEHRIRSHGTCSTQPSQHGWMPK